MEANTNISLEILLLNDLLNSNVIDKSLYDIATKKIKALADPTDIESVLLASA
ncbi:hypothetical protein [Eubacterium sp. AF15-50]|uniref:hypothetical protein n=1 Tax=Eubacterium sp. AF15-50 TaxID=2293103 RepID=UPI002672D163|nr:hypothetical protein [Eubacterium sp. AF15-50]